MGAELGGVREALRGALDALYPPRCIACPEATDLPSGLCASCWAETRFISGAICDRCSVPIETTAGLSPPFTCDACTHHPPAWDRGRAAILYEGAGRRLALAFKHGDRLDMGRTLAPWMAAAGRDLLADADLLVPVPLHWRRLFRRRYNQAAELAHHIARETGRPHAPDALRRARATPSQSGDRAARAANVAAAITAAPRAAATLAGRRVLLIDDVLTTGATLSAAAEACRAAGATRVEALVLARVARPE
ncbi:MAG: ComF family protein [Pseudomonadota bacterium]